MPRPISTMEPSLHYSLSNKRLMLDKNVNKGFSPEIGSFIVY